MALIPRTQLDLKERTGIALYTREPQNSTEFICHYDGGETPKTAQREEQLLRIYDSYHDSLGWGGIGYNLGVGPVTGRVFELRGLDRVGAHTQGHNTSGVGVILIGGEDALTPAAKAGLKEAYAISSNWAGKRLSPYGHSDFADTSCPGKDALKWVRSGEITQTYDDEKNGSSNGGQGNSMSKTPVISQGIPIAPGTLAAYEKMRVDFKAATGYDLLLTSAYRYSSEQEKIFRERYRCGAYSPFGDYRNWNGCKWGRISAAGPVAVPGTSLHESGEAVDLRDSGNSPGVTVAGNARSNWARANAHKYGFSPAGYGFGEPWHFELQGDPWTGNGGGGSGGSSGGTSNNGFSTAYIADIQTRLIGLGYHMGDSGPDGSLGPITTAQVKAFQKKVGLTQDGLPGPATLAKIIVAQIQKAVGADPDGSVGPDTKKRVDAVRQSGAWNGRSFPYGVAFAQSVVGTTQDNSWGPASIKAHDATVTKIQKALGINTDGNFGPGTDSALKKLGM